MNSMTKGYLRASLALALSVTAFACGDDKSTQPNPPSGPYATIQLYAGVPTVAGLGADGLALKATELYLPQDLTFGPDGRAYIVDWNNHKIRVGDGTTLHNLIGTGELGDAPDGPAISTRLNHPTHITFDRQGRLILSAWHNSKVMRMDLTTGNIEKFAGDGSRSFAGDGGDAKVAKLDLPVSCAVDAAGNTFIVDQANQIIRKVDPAGMISTYAGTPRTPGFGGDGGPAGGAMINLPASQSAPPVGRMDIDSAGNLYFCDTTNNRVRKIDTNGVITTIAGSDVRGFSGDGGPATSAKLSWPSDVAVGPDGDIFIADTRNSVIRKVDTHGVITTFAGQGGVNGYEGDGGAPTAAKLDRPYGIAFNSQGDLFIADTHNHCIRVIEK